MTNSLTNTFSSGLRLALMAVMLLGPLAALGMAKSGEPVIAKQGAGLVLFVSLQRQSMS
ncbi:hypothetical protein ACQQ2Q_01730 [Agrobacterium sp. ES01]|uniref:hypothetical protein n=1 Tax=Agrobacterium sp. ES01 TaxID=3420714 RepID=UPI003D1374D4